MRFCPVLAAAVGVTLLAVPAFADFGDKAIGINTHLSPPDVYAAVAAANISWVRLDANWEQLEPTQGSFQWAMLDQAVEIARRNRLQIFATFAYTPKWASSTSGGGDGRFGNDPPVRGLYEKALETAVLRYRGRITHWGLWNEPNLPQFWQGTSQQYVDLIVRPGSLAIKRACPECIVLGPDTAPGDSAAGYFDTVFGQAGDALDIVTHHSYRTFPELDPAAGFTTDSFLNSIEQKRIFSSRTSLREAMAEHGLSHKEVWITETGYQCRGPLDPAQMDHQARYFSLVLEAARDPSRGWWTNTFFYEAEDCGPSDPSCTIDGFGILRRSAPADLSYVDNFNFKPAYLTLRDFVTAYPEFGGSPVADGGRDSSPAAIDATRPSDAVTDGELDALSSDGSSSSDSESVGWDATVDPDGTPAPEEIGGDYEPTPRRESPSGSCSVVTWSNRRDPGFSLFAVGVLVALLQRRLLRVADCHTRFRLPAGYVYNAEGHPVKGPDQRTCGIVSLVFQRFRELQNGRQLFMWFHHECIQVPVHHYAGGELRVVWRLPTMSYLMGMLKNPFFAGAYVRGRYRREPVNKGAKPGRRTRKPLPAEQCRVFKRDHHEGYIEWQEYKQNLEILERNAPRRTGNDTATSVRAGAGLLVGLLRCGHCGRRLYVSYWGRRGTPPRYLCKGAPADAGSGCLSFAGTEVEKGVEAQLWHEARHDLGQTVELAWCAPGCSHALKKKILRTVIDEIIVRRDNDELVCVIHWAGGVHTELRQRAGRGGPLSGGSPRKRG